MLYRLVAFVSVNVESEGPQFYTAATAPSRVHPAQPLIWCTAAGEHAGFVADAHARLLKSCARAEAGHLDCIDAGGLCSLCRVQQLIICFVLSRPAKPFSLLELLIREA